MDLLGHYLQDRQQKIRKTTDGIRSEIYEQLDCGEEISDERLGQIIDEKIRQKQDIQLALEERESIHREIFAAIRDWMYYRNFWKTILLQRLWSTERRIFFWNGAADWNGAVSILKIRRG